MKTSKEHCRGASPYQLARFLFGHIYKGNLQSGNKFHWKERIVSFSVRVLFSLDGGEPIDRSTCLNKVDAIVNVFEKLDEFRLAIAPEGTRKKVDELKSGFYYIALKANVPIIPVAFDFGRKRVSIGKPFYPTANYEADLKILLQHFEGVYGKIPEQGFGFEK